MRSLWGKIVQHISERMGTKAPELGRNSAVKQCCRTAAKNWSKETPPSWLRKNVTIYMCLYFCFWWSLVVCIFYHALNLPFNHNFNASIRACSFEIYSNLKTCTYRTKHWHYHLCAAYTTIFSQAPAFLHSDLPMLSHFSPVHIFLLSL